MFTIFSVTNGLLDLTVRMIFHMNCLYLTGWFVSSFSDNCFFFCLFFYFSCAKSHILRLHSHVFPLFSLSDSKCWQSLVELLPNVMLLSCIRTSLNGQFDLLGNERGPNVSGGAYMGAWPLISLHTESLEARWGPAPLRSTGPLMH